MTPATVAHEEDASNAASRGATPGHETLAAPRPPARRTPAATPAPCRHTMHLTPRGGDATMTCRDDTLQMTPTKHTFPAVSANSAADVVVTPGPTDPNASATATARFTTVATTTPWREGRPLRPESTFRSAGGQTETSATSAGLDCSNGDAQRPQPRRDQRCDQTCRPDPPLNPQTTQLR